MAEYLEWPHGWKVNRDQIIPIVNMSKRKFLDVTSPGKCLKIIPMVRWKMFIDDWAYVLVGWSFGFGQQQTNLYGLIIPKFKYLVRNFFF